MLVYVCSSLKPHTIKRVDRIVKSLRDSFEINERVELEFFRPYGTDPKKMMDTVREDVKAINECDELWVIGRFGRDCSWEIGYAQALGKKIVIWEDFTNRYKLWNDWMWRIGLDNEQVEVRKLKEYL